MENRARFIEASPYTRVVDQKKLGFLYDQIVAGALRSGRDPTDMRVLDLGAGAGAITLALAGLVGHVDAVDIDAPALDKLRARLAQTGVANVTVVEGDAVAHPGEPGAYDVVVASEMIENVPDPAALLANVAMLLRPGGLLLATVPNGYGAFEMRNRHLNPRARLIRSNLLRRLAGKEPYVAGTGPDAGHFFSYGRLLELLGGAGFRVLARANSDFAAPLLGRLAPERVSAADVRLADRVPPAIAGGWYLALAHDGSGQARPADAPAAAQADAGTASSE